jgi:hypothetical protein
LPDTVFRVASFADLGIHHGQIGGIPAWYLIHLQPEDLREHLSASQGSRPSVRAEAGSTLGSGLDDFRLPGNPHGPVTAAEGKGHSASPMPVSRISYLDMHMRLGAVAGVAALADGIARPHWLPRAYLDGTVAQMGEQHKGAVSSCGDHDVIPGHGRNAGPDPFRLAQHVGHERQL